MDPEAAGKQKELMAAERISGDDLIRFATVRDSVQFTVWISAFDLYGYTATVLWYGRG